MKILYGAMALLLVSATIGCAQRADGPIPDGAALADFDKRIKAYAELRDQMEDDAAELDETASPEKIAAAEHTLAARIQAARAAAMRGGIFTPAVERRFRTLLNPEMRGTRGHNTRGIIKDEGPGAGGFPFKVNGVYPKEQPLGSVPANILATLPPLPEDIEYRFIDRHLILRDVRANLIIDYMPNAIS